MIGYVLKAQYADQDFYYAKPITFQDIKYAKPYETINEAMKDVKGLECCFVGKPHITVEKVECYMEHAGQSLVNGEWKDCYQLRVKKGES